MELTERLRRWAYAHPRAFVVDAPGYDALRWAVESALDERGWELATSPADTDVLIVVGQPTSALSDAIDVLWSQVPRPRHALVLADAALLDQMLDAAVRSLATPSEAERSTEDPEDRLAAARPTSGDDEGGDHGDPAGRDVDGDHDMGGHAGHDMGGHAGHDMDGDHDMGGHDMHDGGMVAGLPMAQTAPDRDGLELDTLAIALGPVLPGWPTGLVLRAQLHGDVLSEVELSWLAGGEPAGGPATARPDSQVTALDQLARFARVAGWPTQARRARRARDGLRSPDPAVRSRAGAAAAEVARRIRRSRSLAWSVRGMGSLPADAAGEPRGDRPRVSEDVLDRLRQWGERAAPQTGPSPVAPVSLAALAEALEGTELATARLVVASVALDQVRAPSSEAVTGV